MIMRALTRYMVFEMWQSLMDCHDPGLDLEAKLESHHIRVESSNLHCETRHFPWSGVTGRIRTPAAE